MSEEERQDKKPAVCVGVLAHVDAGKTTFSEQLLYHTGSIRKLGRVDHQDAFMDSDQLERERGITIFSSHAAFETPHRCCYLLDTPGHADFGAEMERAIQAMDYAILVVSCVEGIQAHTEQVWKLLEQYQVPTFFFLNKTDRAGAQPERLLADLRKRMSANICDCSGSFSGTGWSTELIEQVAEQDEELLEQYLDGGYDPQCWQEHLAQQIAHRKMFACFRGSALQDEGIEEFLSALDALTLPRESSGDFQAIAWQVRHDARGERLVFLKVQSGVLKARDEVPVMLADGSRTTQKINELRIYHGTKFSTVQQVSAGQLCAATGLDGVRPGDEIGANCSHRQAHLTPILGAKVVLLEPYYAFEISVMAEQVGRLMSDLQRMESTFGSPVMEEERVTLCGRGPAAALSAYGREFLSYTRGKGVLSLRFDGYEPCSHQEQVAQEIGYDRQRDLENPSCSVFCSHGAGFPVPWDEVPNYIHCK